MDSFFAFLLSSVGNHPGNEPHGSNKQPVKDFSLLFVFLGMAGFSILAIVATKAC